MFIRLFMISFEENLSALTNYWYYLRLLNSFHVKFLTKSKRTVIDFSLQKETLKTQILQHCILTLRTQILQYCIFSAL